MASRPPSPCQPAEAVLNAGPGVVRRARQAWPPGVGSAAGIIAMAGLALSAAACGGSPRSQVAQLGSTTTTTQSSTAANTSAASTQQDAALAFARCMRSHGVPNYPDPTSSGLVKESLQQLGVSSSRFQSASSDCNHLLPNGGSGPNPALVQQVRAQALQFSAVRTLARRPGLPRPRQRRPHTRPRRRWHQSGLAEVRGRKPSLREVPAALHALECRLQRLRQDTRGMRAAVAARLLPETSLPSSSAGASPSSFGSSRSLRAGFQPRRAVRPDDVSPGWRRSGQQARRSGFRSESEPCCCRGGTSSSLPETAVSSGRRSRR